MIWANEAGVSVYVYEAEHDRRTIEIHGVVNDYETVLAAATIEKHNRDRLAEAVGHCATALQSQLEQLRKQSDGYKRLLASAEEQNEKLLEQLSTLEQLRAENERLRKELEGKMKDSLERDLAVANELASMADARIKELESRLAQVEQERKIAVRFLVKQGYARCTEPEHGCDGWHEKL